MSLIFLFQGASLPHLLAFLFLMLICLTDTLAARIPNPVTLVFLLAGFAVNFQADGASGLLHAFLGMATGFSLLIVFYLLGGMGAGDVKALAALGALLGAGAVFQVFLYMGLVGGVMAILHYACSRNLAKKALQGLQTLRTFFYTRDLGLLKTAGKGEKLRFPYAAAIAFGFIAHTRWGPLIPLG